MNVTTVAYRGFRASLHHAIMFRAYEDEPIWHAVVIGSHPFRTVCGREIGNYRPLFPLKHVKKFARPCKSCFPGGGP